ncbi:MULTISPECIES: phycobiliprotein lyase [Arthrospira]|jgi:hypothetical protein|uniref:Chromophore lyase CpcS/CpeS n=1 Tax=Limnospira platensis NIES-46 TaxID=1236695 RepID=A0A5M3T707_LIMPL|nr:phycobiliprotein lyase [Arthrospira platensis]AMW31400.1 chorismate-binding protein [Arthrospira platensis YZ]KDR56135.1 chorismate-binding protein [Arthrospira platensis str. Paraca]MBD2671272.1 phycobiliprotein lyase [Arthrospira platensis FACHB-439]MBD2712239.1 phycobiliprotein lyase [Arthrospira platensis FACHB-835]MDF2208894.1 phycobiliprotein lyase [Arthrospira platensis NCB002]MDT9184843.1 phycobiliprotein lyase [Limnospira sp. PMC 289.06]MDT9297456.1 phycobiliprotein lyase [Arthro
MDIVEFFELSAGKWFSQRTVHNLTSGNLEAGKSNLVMEALAPDHAIVTDICSSHGVDAGLVAKGLQLTWEGTIESNPDQQRGSAVLVTICDRSTPLQGKLLQQQQAHGQNQSLIGRYLMGKDDVLTLSIESDQFKAEERIWYLIPNLRLRTSIVNYNNGLALASFCSEIRMGLT